jgi:hypothetical protein
VTLKHLFVAFACLLGLSNTGACGPLIGPRSGDACDLATYRPRCTDGDAIECSPGSDCTLRDCSGWGCNCDENPHIWRDSCSERGERCVVDHEGARCE